MSVRREGDKIKEIESLVVNSGETDVSGVDVRAQVGWDVAWVDADMVLDARWLRLTRYEARVAGERQPGDHARDRVNGSLRASRDGVTVSWNVLAVSNFWNQRRSGQFDGWTGHDLTAHWRDAFGLSGMALAGGVLNLTDRNPSVDPTDPDAVSATLDSIRGRTIFLSTTLSW